MCPREGHILQEMYLSRLTQNNTSGTEHIDKTASLLSKIYNEAETWYFRRQILSILAQHYGYDTVKEVF